MQTVGELLKKSRELKKIELSQVEKVTKIRSKYLAALESDDYQILPSATAARGFIKNYGNYLGLPNETLQALFRRDFSETEDGQVVPRGMVKPLDKNEIFSWNPQRTTVISISGIALMLVAYLLFQMIKLNIGPQIVISSPAAQSQINGNLVVVKGKTDPDTVVKIGDQLAKIDSEGNFEISLDLPSGENKIVVEATSKTNKSTRKTLDIFIK